MRIDVNCSQHILYVLADNKEYPVHPEPKSEWTGSGIQFQEDVRTTRRVVSCGRGRRQREQDYVQDAKGN
jgi:hypothetical protein